MEDITMKLKKIMDLKKKRKIIYKQSNKKLASIFVDDLSVK
jgi:hypothetical protein